MRVRDDYPHIAPTDHDLDYLDPIDTGLIGGSYPHIFSLFFILVSLMGICQSISGVLVRLTTCKRLINCLPKLSLITTYNTLPPSNGEIAGRPELRADLPISKRFHFLGIPGRVFFKFDMGKV